MQPDRVVMYLHHLAGTRCVLTITKKDNQGGIRADVSIRDPHGMTAREAEFHRSNLIGWVEASIHDPSIFHRPPPGWRWQA